MSLRKRDKFLNINEKRFYKDCDWFCRGLGFRSECVDLGIYVKLS